MNLYEAVKSNTKKYNLIHADSDKISELESGSALTWEGLNSDDDSLSQVVEFFTKESKGFKVPCDIYWWSGKEFNDKYELTGSNKYPDNLTFVSIPLDMWSEMGNLPMLKFQVGARWLDDIVDNNARREGKGDLDEAERVSEIDLKRISTDGKDYDLNFADKLEELGYEFILDYDGKIFYRRDPNKFDDDIIIIDTEYGAMTKVDHNGESLFFSDEEVNLLNQEEVD